MHTGPPLHQHSVLMWGLWQRFVWCSTPAMAERGPAPCLSTSQRMRACHCWPGGGRVLPLAHKPLLRVPVWLRLPCVLQGSVDQWHPEVQQGADSDAQHHLPVLQPGSDGSGAGQAE